MRQITKLSKYCSNKTFLDYYLYSTYMSIKDLNADYPNFNKWFFQKVRNGLLNGTREILIAEENNFIAGILILKKEISERKICTVRVLPTFRKQGIATKLFKYSFEYLQSDHPLITLPEHREVEFMPILNKFGFKKTDVVLKNEEKKMREIIYNYSN